MTHFASKTASIRARGALWLLTLLCAGTAGATDPAAEFKSVDQDVQSLKKQLIDLNRDLFKLEEELLYPASTQVAVFLSVDVGTFFALDSVELTQESRGTIQKNSEYLKRRMSTKIMVEGHADSRGTNEYNLALAERRAGAVRDYLVGLGIAADRITIVSKGEEAPFCTEESESCWQQNRRGHFLFTAK